MSPPKSLTSANRSSSFARLFGGAALDDEISVIKMQFTIDPI
jgi:hypothetical protein